MALIQCKGCGAMISDQASVCPKCGTPVSQQSSNSQQPAYQQVAPTQQSYQATNSNDVPNGGLNVLSFIFPLVGWILWGVYKGSSPVKAGACSKWAWIGFAANIIISLLFSLGEY